MALKRWLIEKELTKKAAERDLLLNTPPDALCKFKKLVTSTLEDKLVKSMEKSYPRFEISFSSEEMSEEAMQAVVLASLEYALASEGIGYSVSSKETRHIRGDRQDPESYNYIVVRGTVTV